MTRRRYTVTYAVSLDVPTTEQDRHDLLTVFQTEITQLIGRDELKLFAHTRTKTA